MSVALYLPKDISNTAVHQPVAKVQLLKMRNYHIAYEIKYRTAKTNGDGSSNILYPCKE